MAQVRTEAQQQVDAAHAALTDADTDLLS